MVFQYGGKLIETLINNYVSDIEGIFTSGEAREESYYSTLESFLKKLWKLLVQTKSSPKIIILPKKTEAGNPDMVIRTPDLDLIGYIEAKAPTINLGDIEEKPQIKTYRETFPFLILTNFIEFRFYRYKENIGTISISKKLTLSTIEKIQPAPENLPTFTELFTVFFSFSLLKPADAKELAIDLATRTRFFRDHVVMEELNRKNEKDNDKNPIVGFYHAFKTYLIHGLSKEEFADLYSQTLTFGLFIAGVLRQEKLKRENAARMISPSGGILRDIFEFISMGKIPKQLECSLNDIVDLLNTINIPYILDNPEGDVSIRYPIIHFYETFLAHYDMKVKEKRGVFYTPESIVNFMVDGVHRLLKEKLGRADGIADTGIHILDPAAGTLAFLVSSAYLAIEVYTEKYGKGNESDFARSFVLNNLYGFELMMAPYVIGHLNMNWLLDVCNVKLDEEQRFNVYLTNTLEMDELFQTSLPGMSTLSRESHLAARIKKELPVTVIIGNPPYSGHSMNSSDTFIPGMGETYKTKLIKTKTWIGEKIEDYKRMDGHSLDEKNMKWLQDDYVKFIRFAQHKIESNGEGIVAFITNHGYLDNPTFRGMRRSLMETFNEIYILDLHGNILKKEKCPDGSADENVFDIRQGVAISFFVKIKGSSSECKVFHSDMWGTREWKYEKLVEEDISTIQWESITPWWEYYLFKPGPGGSSSTHPSEYLQFHKVTDIFPLYSVGIITARDDLTIHDTPEEVEETIKDFVSMKPVEARFQYKLGEDTRDWSIEQAQEDLRMSGIDKKNIVPILYRPFDLRYTYYTGHSRGFHCMPRPEVMKHMLHENIALITVRQVAEGVFNHCFISDSIVESRITTSNKGIGYIFPLYTYPFGFTDPKLAPPRRKRHLFNGIENNNYKEPNINPGLLQLLTEKLGLLPAPTPEAIFHYVYAVLFSNVYRNKYKEYLKIDFPRIPFTGDSVLFNKMVELGKKLIELHLLNSPELNEPRSKFMVPGNNRVERFFFDKDSSSLYINKTQYFSNISEKTWKYELGGYQVIYKYFKSRRGNALTIHDSRRIVRMIESIYLTIECQEQIDAIYKQIDPLKT